MTILYQKSSVGTSMSSRQNEILQQYEKNPRFLSKEFIDSIPWRDIKNHPLEEKFFPVIVYMRDIEAFTDIYYQQLLGTPTGRDPIIRRFMDKWQHEEATHADLLNRFLEEAGYSTDPRWLEKAREQIPVEYHQHSRKISALTNLIGKRFSAVHMTWGAINELSTAQGYKRLWEMAEHPVLEYLLRGIAREEATHIFFYRSIARFKLEESPFARQLSRYIIKKFWAPVGSGIKPQEDTNYVIQTLFSEDEGINAIDQHVNGSIASLPGFKGSKTITTVIRSVALGE